MNYTYKALFNKLDTRKRPKGRKLKIAEIGMPPDRRNSTDTAASVHMKQLEEIFSYLNKSFHPSVGNFTQMMTAYERIGQPEKAVILFQKMKQDGLKPDMISFNVLVKAYGSMGNSAEAVRVLDEMYASYKHPDVVTYTTLMHIFVSTMRCCVVSF